MLICCFIVLWKPWYVPDTNNQAVEMCCIVQIALCEYAEYMRLNLNILLYLESFVITWQSRPLHRLLYLWSGRLWWGPGGTCPSSESLCRSFWLRRSLISADSANAVSSVQSSAGTNSHRTCPTTPEHTKHTTEALLWVHIHNSGSSAVNGCRQNESPNSW